MRDGEEEGKGGKRRREEKGNEKHDGQVDAVVDRENDSGLEVTAPRRIQTAGAYSCYICPQSNNVLRHDHSAGPIFKP